MSATESRQKAIAEFVASRSHTVIVLLVLGVLAVGGLLRTLRGSQSIHVFRRVDDGDRGARLVTGNQVALVWAPAGPGWPNRGVSWDEANRRSRYLKADGLTLADSPQDIWRLPTYSRGSCQISGPAWS